MFKIITTKRLKDLENTIKFQEHQIEIIGKQLRSTKQPRLENGRFAKPARFVSHELFCNRFGSDN